jgi:hypothetical protein
MDGLPEETVSVLRGLIARSEAHREEQIQRVHDLTARGQSTAEARRVLHQIEDTLAALRGRRAYLRMLESVPL